MAEQDKATETPDKGAPKKAAASRARDGKRAQAVSSKKSGGLKIKLVRSVIGSTRHQREIVRGLGLRRLQQTVERHDTPEIRGMVNKVLHLVEVTEG